MNVPSTVVVLAILLCQFGSSQVTVTFQRENLYQCLMSTDLCDMNRSCTNLIIGSSCLKVPIPAMHEDSGRVSCCFKCCSEKHVYTDAIQRNDTFLQELKRRTSRDVSSEHHLSNFFMSKSHLFRLARVVRTASGGNIGASALVHTDIPGYDLSVVQAADPQRWLSTETKRAVFANVNDACLPASLYSQMFGRTSPTGSMIYGFYSYQLPCWPMGVLDGPAVVDSEATVSQGGNQRVAAEPAKSFSERISQSILRMESDLVVSQRWRREVRLLPRGVRSTPASSMALRDLQAMSANSPTRRHLLDCSCAKQLQWGRDLIAQHPRLPCSTAPSHLRDGLHEHRGESDLEKLVQYFKSLGAHSFVLSPSDPAHMSHCEWEALAMGAIPVVADYMRLQPHVRDLYEGLPFLFVPDMNDVSETFLLKKLSKAQEKFRDMSKFNLAKLYIPYWQGEFNRFRVQGKPPMRTWTGVGARVTALQITSCAAVDHRVTGPPTAAGVGSPGKVSGLYVPPAVPRDSTGRVVQRVNLPTRLAHHGGGRSPRFDRLLGDELTDFIAPAHSSRRLYTVPVGGGGGGEESVRDDLQRRAGRSDLRLEFVLPRCCEEGVTEFGWLQEVLQATSVGESSAASIYYKCAQCLPESKVKSWLSATDTPLRNDDYSSVAVLTALDDAQLVALGRDRVYQSLVIDRLHNGKEVTAYLTHIVEHYDHLAAQTVFVHTAPHAHLHIMLFFRFIAWAHQCVANGNNTAGPVDFLHLNVHYKTQSGWATCCGCKIMGGPGSCRRGIWNHLFHDYPAMGPDYELAHTYSSAQFAVSRKQIHRWPRSFYEKMLHAIDGTVPAPGCCNSSTPDPWGGHHLTGQYERMWHMIFGQKRLQTQRAADHSLPQYLRLDCGHDSRCTTGAL